MQLSHIDERIKYKMSLVDGQRIYYCCASKINTPLETEKKNHAKRITSLEMVETVHLL